jgi:fibronectin type 3 domain-containing protein
VKSSSTTSFLVYGTPTTATTYGFSITVKGCGGHVNTKSYSISIKLAPIQHMVALSWARSTSANITGYNVYRATVSGGPYSRINSGGLVASTLYDDGTVKSGATYYYTVTTKRLLQPGQSRSALSLNRHPRTIANEDYSQ